MVLLEVCVDSLQSAINAELGGAERVELCDNLIEGGTTPSYGVIFLTKKHLKIPVNVLIRPRGGDFLYSEEEYEVMKEDVKMCKSIGVNGVVIGFLMEDGRIDYKRTLEIVELAQPLKITFHRAIDMCSDWKDCIEKCIEAKIDRILTSGLNKSAQLGISVIKEMIEYSNDRIIIMPGGGISELNVREITSTGVIEVHGSIRKVVQSKMIFQNKNIFMGGNKENTENSEFITKVADSEKIACLVHKIGE